MARAADSVRVDNMKVDAEDADTAQVTVEARIMWHGDTAEQAAWAAPGVVSVVDLLRIES